MKRRVRVGILGAGAWGTAMAKHLAEKGHKVNLWCYEAEVAREINERHTNSRYLMGVELPEKLQAVTDPQEAVARQDFLLVAVPSLFVIPTLKRILPRHEIVEGRIQIGVLTKGFIEGRDGVRLICEAMEDYLPGIYKGRLTYISGPSHAEEVARHKITGLICASASGMNAVRFRRLITGGAMMVFSALDIRGVQICAALKNVIAIAYGMLDALREFTESFGDNTESLLLAAGLSEIQKVGRAMGATHPETFTSIAGVGDLDVTCRSKYGRNRRFGREIVIDRTLDRFRDIGELIAALPTMGAIPEGAAASRFVYELARRQGLDVPICNGVYRVLNREVEPIDEVERIVRRIMGGTEEVPETGALHGKLRLPSMLHRRRRLPPGSSPAPETPAG